MLFAILDYIKYKRRRGPYSDESIRKQGGRLAVPESVPELQQFGPRQRFLYHTRDSFLSWLIMYYTSSVWSHVGNFTEHGYILDATTAGIMEHPFSDYFDGKSYLIILQVRDGWYSEDGLAKGLEWGRSKIGCGFNWLGLWRFFWSIILGRHAHFRLRFAADLLIALLLLSPLACLSRTVGILLVLASAIYVLIVAMNSPNRRAMRRRFAECGGGGDQTTAAGIADHRN